MDYYQPNRLDFEGTVTGSGGEHKVCWTYRDLGIDFVHCPFGIDRPPDFEVTTPIYFDDGICKYHQVEHKRSDFVSDAVNGRLKPGELYAYSRLIDLSKFHPLAIIEDFNKFTWLVDGQLFDKQTTYFDRALVKFYHLDMLKVRRTMYRALDAYALARKAANDNKQANQNAA